MWERLSYFITAVAAVLGWLITHYVDRVTQTPTIEYSISETAEDGARRIEYRLTNVNRNQAFGPIEVRFISPRSSPIIDSLSVRPVEPASEGSGNITTTSHSAQFDVPKMLPGSAIKFTLRVKGPKRPHIYLLSKENKESIHFTRRGLDTWVAANETKIVVWLIGIWIVILLGLVGLATVSAAKSDKGEPKQP